MNESRIWPAVISGLALIIGASIFGGLYYQAQLNNSKDSLSVTGSAKTHVTADQAKLVVNISRASVADLAVGYREIARDLNLTRDLLRKSGVDDGSVVESPVSMFQNYDSMNGGRVTYQINQSVTVQSGDVAKMTEVSKKIPSLAEQGAIVSVATLEYYYSKLPDLRISLLTDAVKDAKSRAEKIADGTGRKVGGVQSASSGVVQVLTPNSVDVSDYGSYDTSSIEKDVMVTTKVVFGLQ